MFVEGTAYLVNETMYLGCGCQINGPGFEGTYDEENDRILIEVIDPLTDETVIAYYADEEEVEALMGDDEDWDDDGDELGV